MSDSPVDDVAALVRRLGDERVDVSDLAVHDLLRLGTGRALEPILFRVVESSDTALVLRRNCARVLNLLGLVRDLGHVLGRVREHAVAELTRLGTDGRIALDCATRSDDPIVSANARRALVLLARGAAPGMGAS